MPNAIRNCASRLSTPRVVSQLEIPPRGCRSGSPFPDCIRVADLHDKSLSRGQKLSGRAQEERVKKFFAIFSFAVVASRQLFLQYAEPDIHDKSLSRGQKLSGRAQEE